MSKKVIRSLLHKPKQDPDGGRRVGEKRSDAGYV